MSKIEQMETNTIRYEFVEGLSSDNSEVVAEASAEFETQSLDQLEQGYLPTDIVGNEEILFTEYTLNPQFDAVSEVLTSGDIANFETQVTEQQDLGQDLVAVSYVSETGGEGEILSYFGETENGISYEISDNADDLVNLINDEDLSLQNVEYGDGTWLATFDSSDNLGSVSVGADFDELTGQIEGQTSGGSTLVDLEYGDGTWIARYSEYGDAPTASSYYTSEDLGVFQAEVTAQQEQGYSLVDVEYVGEAWYGVFNETLGSTEAGNDVADIAPTYDPAAIDAVLYESQLYSETNQAIIDNFDS
ncbi:MAG: hypothetical protein HC930_11360 [Hydrococcus sp. SU_1_0]|nr:hypothetical protein [Hydrococcus sp. SU_1_0]